MGSIAIYHGFIKKQAAKWPQKIKSTDQDNCSPRIFRQMLSKKSIQLVENALIEKCASERI